jgi:phosphinothricin acetyltransferase
MKIIPCDELRHSGAILKIFNDAILTSTALYEYKPRTPEIMKAWFENKRKGSFPVIVAEDDHGQLLGFGSYGAFRAFPGYKYTVEHSVYVDASVRARGIGRALLQELINLAQKQNYHVLIGVIDTTNAASIALHESLNFTRCAHLRDVGFKFGRWLDVAFYQLILPTPANPIDG